MAKVLGKAGRYVSHESVKQFGRTITIALIGLMLFSGVTGFSIAKNHIILSMVAILAAWGIFIFFYRHAKKHYRYSLNYKRGAYGEERVNKALTLFPDEYYVINDLTTNFGNIDHVVIGPSGVYVIETKNWRGTITAGENSELLIDGKPTDKPEVKILTSRVMNVREKVKTLCGLDPFFNGVIVFPSARVEAKWGTTGNVHCVEDEQLYDYIVDSKKNNKLSKKEIESISQAFLALARMDKDFDTTNK